MEWALGKVTSNRVSRLARVAQLLPCSISLNHLKINTFPVIMTSCHQVIYLELYLLKGVKLSSCCQSMLSLVRWGADSSR